VDGGRDPTYNLLITRWCSIDWSNRPKC